MKKFRLLSGLFLSVLAGLFFPAGQACADSAALTPAEIAARLQAAYEATTSMSADFKQVATVAMSNRKRTGNGRVVVLKPGRIRWDYVSPDHQVLVSDGKKIFMYFAGAEQMIIQPVSEYLNSDITYSFFVGTGNILRDFEVQPADLTPGQGSSVVKLVPKNAHPQVDYLYVWVDNSTYLMNRLEIVDQFGSVTDISFTNIVLNQPVAKDTFTFSPPEGTEIIEQ